jgi:hypothetical protein
MNYKMIEIKITSIKYLEVGFNDFQNYYKKG